jgi:hypothetical protein
MNPDLRRCSWWRRGRVELPVQWQLPRIYYRLASSLSDLYGLNWPSPHRLADKSFVHDIGVDERHPG